MTTRKFLRGKCAFPDGTVVSTSIPQAPNRYILVSNTAGFNGFSWAPDPRRPHRTSWTNGTHRCYWNIYIWI
jgi:hypothetical protein